MDETVLFGELEGASIYLGRGVVILLASVFYAAKRLLHQRKLHNSKREAYATLAILRQLGNVLSS